MSLPTPPGTSHRADKENRLPSSSGCRVVWSQHNQYHSLTNSPPSKLPIAAASAAVPTKSILKKSAHVLLSVPEENQRETTPEPSDPLVNLTYLVSAVSTIVAMDASLRDLIESYSVLTARVRASVTGATDADASWPLFQPLRKHRDAFVDALIRDIGRATMDPSLRETDTAEDCKEEAIMLPSPKDSPRRKKGMSAEQVKYARDLCTTSHAAIKLLAVVFTLPAVYKVFSDEQLRAIITQVLAIPLAPELPTPNARKTCALSIWILQSQRLPHEVLEPAKDRIAYALRRGIEGELGKEGKKGSASDGLKAIHDLSMYQPTTFIAPFTKLLPTILANLLAPSLALRAQAAHALGGFVLGYITLPPSSLRAQISAVVASYLTTPPATPSKKSGSSQDSTIVRTLRTTLNATEPQHAAQGPVWALNVVASFIVLLGPVLCTDLKISRMISALLVLSIRHKKSSVRAIGCLVWRAVAWTYFQPELQSEDVDTEGEDEVEDEIVAEGEKKKSERCPRETWWKLVKSVVDMGTGVATIAALRAEDTPDSRVCDADDNLQRILTLIRLMIKRGGPTCGEAMEVMKTLVTSSAFDSSAEWTMNKLLPSSLFSSNPGLLTAEWRYLGSTVRPIFEESPQLDHIRPLTRDELAKAWVFKGLVDLWREGLACVQMHQDGEAPIEIIEIWEGLLKSSVIVLHDAGDDDGIIQLAIHTAEILAEIVQDANLDLTAKRSSGSTLVPTSPIKPPSKTKVSQAPSNGMLKLSLVRALWSTMRRVFPNALLNAAGEKLLLAIVENEDELVYEAGDAVDSARESWASICAEVLVVCDLEEMKWFWGGRGGYTRKYQWSWPPDVRNAVWKSFTAVWRADPENKWEAGVFLLNVPYVECSAWNMDDDAFRAWEDCLQYTLGKALDDGGEDTIAILNHIADAIAACPVANDFTTSTRVADALLTNLDIVDARELPVNVIDIVMDTLIETYPPEPRNKIKSSWMLRSLTRVLDLCPIEFRAQLFEALQDGLCTWISDDYNVFTEDEYSFDIVPLYQTILIGIQSLPQSVQTLDTFSSLLESGFARRNDKPEAISQAFSDFWETAYGGVSKPEEGWPDRIQTCLDVVFPPITTSMAVDDSVYDADVSLEDISVAADETFEVASTNEDDEPLAFPDSDEEDIQTRFSIGSLGKLSCKDPAKPESSSSRHLGPASFTPLLPAFSECTENPSTPKSGLTSTPSRPHKSAVSSIPFPSFSLRSPASPVSQRAPSTPKRTLTMSPGSSSNKHRKTGPVLDKENMSPIASVTDRIIKASPAWTSKSSVLGKRRSTQEWQEGSALKKAKAGFGARADTDGEDEHVVETNLPIGPFPKQQLTMKASHDSFISNRSDSSHSSSGSSTRKRKGVFMDAVELPTLCDVQRNLKKLRRARASLNLTTAAILKAPTNDMVPSRSVTALPTITAASTIEDGSAKKRRKHRTHAIKSDTIRDPFSSSPLRALEDVEVAGSDDSIVFNQSARESEHSSDDDPHIGQVTPHHLISPALRRAQDFDCDPPSDDSTMSASPTRDVAARRLERSSSFSSVKPSPFTVRSLVPPAASTSGVA